jgi:hypothetical protein
VLKSESGSGSGSGSDSGLANRTSRSRWADTAPSLTVDDLYDDSNSPSI